MQQQQYLAQIGYLNLLNNYYIINTQQRLFSQQQSYSIDKQAAENNDNNFCQFYNVINHY